MSVEDNHKKSGLATASLVIGIVGMALSFIPLINNVAFFLGILAFVFGLIPLLKKTSKGKAIAGIVLGILAIVITLVMQSAISDAFDEAGKELDKMSGNSTEEVLKNDVEVKLGDFDVVEGQYGLNDTKLVVSVKNITKEKKSFTLHIEAVDKDGKRIEDDYVYASDLNAGQTQDFEIFTYVADEKLSAMKSATFKIVEASAI